MDDALIQSLRTRLSEFDGKAVTLLGEAEASLSDNLYYVDALIVLSDSSEGKIADGATWLIKSALERGTRLTATQTLLLIEQLPKIKGWPAQLHVCQSIRYLAIPAGHAQLVARLLAPLLNHRRPFLRAWALDALDWVARVEPGLRGQVSAAMDEAERDDAASVRARAKAIRCRKI